MLLAKIVVTLKKEVSDPQGLALGQALQSMQYEGIEGVRVGRFFEIQIDGADRADAEKQLHDMCEKILSNPVVEEYEFEIEEA